MVPEINIWAVLLATVSTMVVGSIWYTPKVFGTRWAALAKVDLDGSARSAVWPIVITVIVSFISALVLAGAASIAHDFYGGSFLVNTLVTGGFLWGGFTAARFITHDAFEGRPAALTLMNIAHELVTVLIMALIIGAFGISG